MDERARGSLRVSAVQMNTQADVAENLAACGRAVALAAEAGARLVLLPENFAFFGPEARRREIAESLDDEAAPIRGALSRLAAEHRITVIGGGMPERSADPARPFNTSVAFGPDGRRLAAYRKIHLFDVDLPDGTAYRESGSTSAGDAPVVVDVDGVRVGLSVCYDLRFPELFRALAAAGAEVLLVPAAFTLQTGKDHWSVLLRARAIECSAWVVAAAQWGKHPGGRVTYGHSLVADPWGAIVAQASDGAGIVTADVDLAYLDSVRRSLPCLAHRRL